MSDAFVTRMKAMAREPKVMIQKREGKPNDLLQVVCHDLQGTLGPLITWLRLLQARQLERDEARHAAEVIERGCLVMLRLARDLVAIVETEHGYLSLEMSVVDLREVVRTVIRTFSETARSRQVTVTSDLPPEAVPVLADEVRLSQVFSNLLGNALKFTAPSGMIFVKLWTGGDQAHVSVTDTGAGIAPDVLPHVFERSFTEGHQEAEGAGHGLGLYVVKHLVEQHGGTVRVDSPGEGWGTSFRVTLPLAGRAA